MGLRKFHTKPSAAPQFGACMYIGLGIFLLSVVFALVIFYAITKNRWRWARALIALIVLTGAVIGGLYLWKQLPPTISPQTEYAGIRLGMGPDEVLSVNGSPPAVYGEAEKEGKWRGFQPIIETRNLEKGKVVQDYRVWSYEQSSNHIDVTFNPEKTAVVAIACYSIDRQGRCPSIGGVKDGDSELEVVRKLGTPGTSRTERGLPHMTTMEFITYPKSGIELWLGKEERVYMLGINDPKYPREDR
jgi:hypothetical protein